MGEVIRKGASVDEIYADLKATNTNAQAAGGIYKTLAEQTLKSPLLVCESIDAKLRAAVAKFEPLQAAQGVCNVSADRLIGRVSDGVWNDVDRPAHDPQYDLLFPSGVTYYTDVPDDEQPARMELLAELLESGIHERLDLAKAKDYAQQIRKEAAAFEAAIDAARKPRAQAAMYERMRVAVIRSAHGALAAYKRQLKAKNVSEAQIHAIIPDRPAPPAPKPQPTPVPPTN